jgi:predicted MFS family arabinose efflux permease
MNHRQHTLIGFIAAAIVVLLTHLIWGWFNIDIRTAISLVVITYIFSLLPDIDHRISQITWLFLGIGIAGILTSVINSYYSFIPNGYNIMIPSIVLLVLTFICAKYAKHRGIIHTLRIGAIFSALVYFIVPDWRLCIIAMIAYQSHLMADGYAFRI